MNTDATQANAAQCQLEDAFQILVEGIRDQAVLLLDHVGNVRSWNSGLLHLNGYTSNEIIGKHFSHFYTPENIRLDKPQSDLRQALSNGVFSEHMWLLHKDGSRYLAYVTLTPLLDEQSNLLGYAKVFRRSRDGVHSLMDAPVNATPLRTADAIMITDTDGKIIRVNQSFQSLVGYNADELQGRNARILSSGIQEKGFYATLWDALISQGAWSGEIRDKRKDGAIFKSFVNISAIRNDYGDIVEFVAVYKDLSDENAKVEASLRLAYFDALTNLPNRRLLMDRLQMSIASTQRNKRYSALLFLDIDNFKALNDSMGHDYGDQLLIQVATRIRSCVREVDTVARLGGDEFVVLFEQVDAKEDKVWKKVGHVAEKIRETLAEPYLLKSKEYRSSPSIGVTLFGNDTITVETILKQADIAMYHAKSSGRNTVRFFDPHMQQAVAARALLESELSRAVPDRQLRLHYQMQVDADLKPVGAEAFVRWIHPNGGLIPPAQFIPLAEESALILMVGQWVLETACAQLETWSTQPAMRDIVLSVNISPQQIKMSDFVESISDIVNAHHINPSKLRLEFDESAVLSDVPYLIEKLAALKELGVMLALDDFGTGYSSLTYLRQLPIDQLKIDSSFVREINSHSGDTVMVEAIIDMAARFGLSLIAEGVENREQMDFLHRHGCRTFQGYHFSKPLPIAEFDKMWTAQLDRVAK